MKPHADDAAPAVKLADVNKVYRDFWLRDKARAVDRLSLEIMPGEVYGLLGPNGSGKSTTLKMILGLLFPTAGSIELFGRSPGDVATKARIGYMPEDSNLYKYLTARETLEFYGRLFDIGGVERRERVRQLIAMVGLGAAADRPIGEFSKGMGRRIGLAQALINDPELIVLDEPTAGLDPIGCRQVKDLILALARRGKTVVLASHLLADVEDVCSRIGILYNGRLLAQGGVADLLCRRERIRVTMKSLEKEALDRILREITKEAGERPDTDYPTQTLEQFFVEVVGRAQKQSGPGAGADGAGGVAEYLAGGGKA